MTTLGPPRRRARRANQPARHAELRHLHLAPVNEEWPDDLLVLLGQARDGYLGGTAVRPSAEIQAFLEIPAHGMVDASRMVPATSEPEAEPVEILLLPAGAAGRPTPRRLAGFAGAAAALLLVAFGVRPALTGAVADDPVVPTSSVAPPTAPTAAPTTTPPTVPATTVPVTPAAPAPAAATALAEAPPTTAPAGAAPATRSGGTSRSSGSATTKRTTKSTAKPSVSAPAAAAPRPAPTPAPAAPAPSKPAAAKPKPPAPAASPRQAVAIYYVVANERGRCVAHLGAGKSRAQKIAACGPEPVPPANLVQYWAAKNAWTECAAPLQAKGWRAAKVESRCGTRPDRADYDVPPNPFSRSG